MPQFVCPKCETKSSFQGVSTKGPLCPDCKLEMSFVPEPWMLVKKSSFESSSQLSLEVDADLLASYCRARIWNAIQSKKSSELAQALDYVAGALSEADGLSSSRARAAASKLAALLNGLDPLLTKKLQQLLQSMGEKSLAQAMVASKGLIKKGPPVLKTRHEVSALVTPPSPMGGQVKGLDFLPKMLGPYKVTPDSFRYDLHGVHLGELQLAATHNKLLAAGFTFIGYRGTTRGFAEAQINRGIRREWTEYRPLDDPWRGLYIAEDYSVCAGYTGDKSAEAKYVHTLRKTPTEATSGDLVTGVLVRVYAPREVVTKKWCRLRVKDMSQTDIVEKEFKKTMKFALPNDDKLYIISGPQGGEDSHGAKEEAVLSWKLAERCVIIPSLMQVQGQETRTLNKKSDTELERFLNANDKICPTAKLPKQKGVTAFNLSVLPKVKHGNSVMKLGLQDDSSEEEEDPILSWKPPAKKKMEDDEEGEKEWKKTSDYTQSYVGAFQTSDKKEQKLGKEYQELLKALTGMNFGENEDYADVAALLFETYQVEAWNLHSQLEKFKKMSLKSLEFQRFSVQFRDSMKAGAIPVKLSTGPRVIWLSGHLAASDGEWQKKNVGCVFNCCDFIFPAFSGIIYKQVKVEDFSNGLFLWACNQIDDYLKRSKDNILVHCIEGRNRSATIVTAYLMKAEKLSAEQAILKLQKHRPWAAPDQASLWEWEDYLAGRLPGKKLPSKTKSSGGMIELQQKSKVSPESNNWVQSPSGQVYPVNYGLPELVNTVVSQGIIDKWYNEISKGPSSVELLEFLDRVLTHLDWQIAEQEPDPHERAQFGDRTRVYGGPSQAAYRTYKQFCRFLELREVKAGKLKLVCN